MRIERGAHVRIDVDALRVWHKGVMRCRKQDIMRLLKKSLHATGTSKVTVLLLVTWRVVLKKGVDSAGKVLTLDIIGVGIRKIAVVPHICDSIVRVVGRKCHDDSVS